MYKWRRRHRCKNEERQDGNLHDQGVSSLTGKRLEKAASSALWTKPMKVELTSSMSPVEEHSRSRLQAPTHTG
jgi:hypothetical protein